MSGERVTRIDVGRLDKFERLPSGGLRIPASLTRVGVLVYRSPDGSEIRELRPVDEVFDSASMRSFEDAAVTDLHPEGMVDGTNWRELAVGTVRDVRSDGGHLVGLLAIHDADEIRRIEAEERVEVSSGYTCELDLTPGTYDGQPYDAIQRRIRYNHAALGPRGWGRAGPEVSLRLDAAHEVVRSPDDPPARRVERNDSMTKRMVRVDGYDFEEGSDQHLQALTKVIERKDGELAERADELTKVSAKLQETEGRLDSEKERAAKLDTDLKAATERADKAWSRDEIDARVESRLALVDRARRVLGKEYTGKGKTDSDVMKDALEKLGVKVDDGKGDAYILGRFEQATHSDMEEGEEEHEEETDDSRESSRGDGGGTRRSRSDGVRVTRGDDRPVEGLDKVRKDNADFHKNWQSGFAVSAGGSR
ncbi:MAG: DUF2213 domain-containing protein [Sandaracinaceae bacterium]